MNYTPDMINNLLIPRLTLEYKPLNLDSQVADLKHKPVDLTKTLLTPLMTGENKQLDSEKHPMDVNGKPVGLMNMNRRASLDRNQLSPSLLPFGYPPNRRERSKSLDVTNMGTWIVPTRSNTWQNLDGTDDDYDGNNENEVSCNITDLYEHLEARGYGKPKVITNLYKKERIPLFKPPHSGSLKTPTKFMIEQEKFHFDFLRMKTVNFMEKIELPPIPGIISKTSHTSDQISIKSSKSTEHLNVHRVQFKDLQDKDFDAKSLADKKLMCRRSMPDVRHIKELGSEKTVSQSIQVLKWITESKKVKGKVDPMMNVMDQDGYVSHP